MANPNLIKLKTFVNQFKKYFFINWLNQFY